MKALWHGAARRDAPESALPPRPAPPATPATPAMPGMPATPSTPATPAPMTRADVDEVMALETRVYPFPWTRGNFTDSLAAGYFACTLRDGAGGPLLGYAVAMAGAGEVHLLNITVAPTAQRRGLGRCLLLRVLAHGRDVGASRLWLEVRESNLGAQAAYARLRFQREGRRPGYYPADGGQREAAIVLSLPVGPASEDEHALG